MFNVEDIGKFFKCINGGIVKVVIDNNLRIEYADEKFYRLAGDVRDNLLGYLDECSKVKILNSIKNRTTNSVSVVCKLTNNMDVMFKCIVYLENNIECMYCVVLKDSELDYYIREIDIEKERYKAIMNVIQDSIVEVDSKGYVLYCSKEFNNKFAYDVVGKNFEDYLIENCLVYDEDIEGFKYVIDILSSGISDCSMEVRIKNSINKFIWCEIYLTGVKDDRNNLLKIIMVIKDINKERNLRNQLLNKVNRDGLTGLYNKKSGLELIESLLKREISENSYLIFFDVDNFKGVNDKYGHIQGDVVLKKVAECMRNTFRNKDILCRFGGDEYCIYLTDIDNSTLERKIKDLLLKVSYIEIDNKSELVSISLGAVKCKSDEDISDILNKADIALYSAKESGKNTYKIYNE